MKKLFTLIGVLLLWQSVAVAQNYLHIWTGDSTKIVPVAALDSVTFRDAKFYDADFSNVDGLRFSGSVTDYWGSKVHSFDVTLAQGTGSTVYIRNLDPYFAVNGITAENGCNILTGELAVATDGKSATITCQPDQAMGYNDCVFANPFDGGTINFTLTETTLTCETGYGVGSSEGWYTAFNPFALNAVSGARAPGLVRNAASHPTLHAPQRLLESTSKQEDKQEAMQLIPCPEDVTID
jgi:hypothetical protein